MYFHFTSVKFKWKWIVFFIAYLYTVKNHKISFALTYVYDYRYAILWSM